MLAEKRETESVPEICIWKKRKAKTYFMPTHCLLPFPKVTKCLPKSSCILFPTSHLSGLNMWGSGKTSGCVSTKYGVCDTGVPAGMTKPLYSMSSYAILGQPGGRAIRKADGFADGFGLLTRLLD